MAGLGRMALVALGIVAYKNRDKLAAVVTGAGQEPGDPSTRGGLGDLLDKLRNAVDGDTVDSWIGNGTNKPIDGSSIERAIDNETLVSLSEQTGMSRDESLERLATNLPEVVNDLTPDGRMPETADFEYRRSLDSTPPPRT